MGREPQDVQPPQGPWTEPHGARASAVLAAGGSTRRDCSPFHEDGEDGDRGATKTAAVEDKNRGPSGSASSLLLLPFSSASASEQIVRQHARK